MAGAGFGNVHEDWAAFLAENAAFGPGLRVRRPVGFTLSSFANFLTRANYV